MPYPIPFHRSDQDKLRAVFVFALPPGLRFLQKNILAIKIAWRQVKRCSSAVQTGPLQNAFSYDLGMQKITWYIDITL